MLKWWDNGCKRTSELLVNETKFIAPDNGEFLRIMPISLFSAVMGLVGLGLAWNKAAYVLDTPSQIADSLVIVGAAVFLVLTIAFIRRALRCPAAVAAEYQDPALTGYYSTIPIGVLLISAHATNYWSVAASAGFWVSTVSLVALTVLMLVRFLRKDTAYQAVNGSWLIGMVSPILVPLAGIPLGYGEISHFCFSVGFALWLVIFPITLARLMFGPATPLGIRPTWFIIIVPPMIIFIGYISIKGGTLDFFARSFFYLGLFLLIALIVASRDIRNWPFSIAWWAFTFPLDGAAAAALTYHEHSTSDTSYTIAIILLTLASLVVAFVSLRTLTSLFAGTLFLSPPSGSAS